MNRLLIVSNRLPVTVQKRGGELHLSLSVGGLATGLGSIYRQHNAVWLGWPGIAGRNLSAPDREIISQRLSEIRCEPVYLSDQEFDWYYNGFCNKAVWPLFHYFPHYAVYDPAFWKGYIRVNRKFCDAVCAIARPGDRIWVHDYQLMLLPGMLREKLPDATIGYFLHIPFPQYEIFRLIPWRKEILEGLMGADLIGFHTFEYATYFFNCVRRILGYEQEMTWIKAGDRQVRVDTFPMGIDYEKFSLHAGDPDVKKEALRIRKSLVSEKILLSMDRLDYSKGVPLRLKAFDRLLDIHPELKEKVTLVLVAVPSRTRIEQYAELRHEVEHLVGRINGNHGTMCWTPVRYLFKSLPFSRLLALYSIADLALVSPVRDGMNLMAKEYIAAKTGDNGMLVLSEFAGAARELGEAILVNPNNTDEFAGAIYQGLVLPEPERQARVKAMQERLRRYDLDRWTTDFLDVLERTKAFQQMLAARFMDARSIRKLTGEYRRASRRVLFLDYDGTLVPIAKTPQEAGPDEEILAILSRLSQEPGTDVVIISGRDRPVLERWFGAMDLGLIAEHGIWIRERGGEWEMPRIVSKEWKDEIRPILERYTDRTPGTFVEEKEYSLAWHYRRAEPGLARIRAGELREDLMLRTKSLRLAVLEGSKVFEVKSADVHKGAAVQHWLKKYAYDFIFAAGDDRTDEDVFAAVPPDAVTFKVGINPSRARYSIRTVGEIRDLFRAWSIPMGATLKKTRSRRKPPA
jgi:trehalose 6-phosphate synthase/phosphatase